MAAVTTILNQIQSGDIIKSEIIPTIYAELRRLADKKLRSVRRGETLQPTALVHEAYLRLLNDRKGREWENRSHFFAAAAEAMRRILVEYTRNRKSLKRGGNHAHFEVLESDAIIDSPDFDVLLDLDAALQKLSESDPELSRLVELRYFAGLSVEDAAQVLEVSPRTVKRNWSFARAWLGRELNLADKESQVFELSCSSV